LVSAYTGAFLLTFGGAAMLLASDLRRSRSGVAWAYAWLAFVIALSGAGLAWCSNRRAVRELVEAEGEAVPLVLSAREPVVRAAPHGVHVLLGFSRSRDVAVGPVAFEVAVEPGSPARVLSIAPDVSGVLFEASWQISEDGRSASIRFDVPGDQDPAIDLVLSEASPITVEGRPGLERKELRIAPDGS
jgi:hypothetical protein